MDKLFAVTLLGCLMAVHGTLESPVLDDVATLSELENLDIEDGADVEFYDYSFWTSDLVGKAIVSVDDFGAVGDGVADDTQAFRNAWKTVCSTQNAVFMVPKGRRYLISATRFQGPCSGNLVIQIDATIVAPDDPRNWEPKDMRTWLIFSKLKGAVFQGSGVIDGSGAKWWESSCKKKKSNPCRGAPTALTIASSSAVKITGLTIRNSQQMHFVIYQSDSVRVDALKIFAPFDSPNTDGIHITGSTNVVVQDTMIGTGDDCISIVSGSSDIKMKRISCGPGHGISIGSLGKDNSTGIVTKVVLETAVLKNTTNGLRIKTWQGGNGYVEAVLFSKVKMVDVANPIIIDQNYCDSPKPCSKQSSAVQIRKIMYKDICGTTKSKQAIKFDCSDNFPCTNIVVNNVKLEKEGGAVETFCHAASGRAIGVVLPAADCLERRTPRTQLSSQEELVHTEL